MWKNGKSPGEGIRGMGSQAHVQSGDFSFLIHGVQLPFLEIELNLSQPLRTALTA
jgi:hypothetical protein